MANPCDNTFYAYSENPKNIEAIEKFFDENKIDYDSDSDHIDAWFDTKWTFSEELMNELFEAIPDKTDIYMRDLAVEYGNDYVSYWKCEDERGWYQLI